MGFNCGIVGLPNVGKSTLFNALTQAAQAEAANYPFCTIEPNVGRVPVPDPRLHQLAEVAKSRDVIPTQLEFVDIAGLVRGASRGEGLGNQFLGNIRQVDAIVHLLRCFEDETSHVEGGVDPIRDADAVETELMLADLESLERQLDTVQRKAKTRDKEALAKKPLLERLVAALQEGTPARDVEVSREELPYLKEMHLLTRKPVLYVANVGESEVATGNRHSERVAQYARENNAGCVTIAAEIEAEVAALTDPEEKRAFLDDLGLERSGLDRVITAGYALLNLITFFTAGPKEARAWTIPRGASAPEAAGAIHSDMQRGFIRAETIHWRDFVDLGGENAAKDAGKMRVEGREYVVNDGDVMHIRFNV